MSRGERPATCYDGSAWGDGDWMDVSTPLNYKIALLWIKGDWSEHARTLGLQSWASKFSPCQFCHSTTDELRHVDGVAHPDGPGWHLKQHSDYADACAQ
eukprot:4504615-Pyramimonas_sp.AAC.1